MTAGLVLLCAAWSAAPLDASPQFTYTGALVRGNDPDTGSPVKRFTVKAWWIRGDEQKLFHWVEEKGGGGWAWPERFGVVPVDDMRQTGTGPLPRLLYDHQGSPVVITLPSPVFAAPIELTQGATWMKGRDNFEVVRSQKVAGRDCWRIEGTTGLGRRHTMWVDKEAPVVVSFEQRMFLGQGDQYFVTLTLDAQKTLDASAATAIATAGNALVKLKQDLKRADGEPRGELSNDQLEAVKSAMPEVTKLATGTPFADYVADIAKDLKQQGERTLELAKLATKFVGQTAPALDLRNLDSQKFDPAALKGKIVVLHFWEYQKEPLVEPYGQVGYIDFLAGKRKKLGVEFVGVHVDKRLVSDSEAPAAKKSALGLKSFMNLSYPVFGDDGALLKKLGDPRQYGAKLPLWIVIDSEGKIAHYSVGLFNVNPDEGLRELDDVLVKLIREQRKTP